MIRRIVLLAAAWSALGCRGGPAEIHTEARTTPAAAEAIAPTPGTTPATESGFEAIFQAEQTDPACAAEREAAVLAAFATPGAPKLLAAVCKNTICRLEMVNGDSEPPMNLPRSAVQNVTVAFYRSPTSVVVYLSRPGHGLPTSPNVAAKAVTVVNGKTVAQ